ncbi:MAG: DNA polymerase I, partial [Syntrophomonadaceae bacterium]|nr:DNA polymerase I [Syntrophomonadaceae bacterium]
MARMMILDGNSLVNRAFYALPPLTSAEGLPTNAVHGFLTMLFRLQKEQKPDYWAVVFDKSKPTVRINQFAEYKAQRKPTPDALRPQFAYLKEILEVMQVPILELEGYEADDIIAAAADKAGEKGIEVSIYTGDRDALQLINPGTKVYLTVKGISEVKCYDEERLAEEYGLKPEQIIDLKGLAGDASDNIPGVPGIGQKTALKLLHEYGTVENILKQKENIQGDKIKKLLAEYAEQALLSKKLAALIHDVPLEFSLDDLVRREPDLTKCKTVLHSYSLYKVAQLFEQSCASVKKDLSVQPADKPAGSEDHPALEVIVPDGSGWIGQMNAWQEEKAVLSLGYRYEGDCVHRGKWTEMGICDGKNTYLLERGNQPSAVLEKWYELLADDSVRKIVADSKTLRVLLLNEQKILNGVDVDLSLAAYLLNPSLSAYQANDLLREYGSGLLGFPAPREAELLRKIAPAYVERIAREKLEMLLYEVEEPLSRVLAVMENQGITVDKELLTRFGDELGEKIDRLEGEIYELAGSRFNLNSPQQLGKVLFEDLKLPPMKKNKTGYSTDAETLEELRPEHPVIDKLLQYRQLVK